MIAGEAGHMTAFMAQAGTMLIGGDVGDALGDSLYEAVIYVGGSIRSLGADARVEDLTDRAIFFLARTRTRRWMRVTGE